MREELDYKLKVERVYRSASDVVDGKRDNAIRSGRQMKFKRQKNGKEYCTLNTEIKPKSKQEKVEWCNGKFLYTERMIQRDKASICKATK